MKILLAYEHIRRLVGAHSQMVTAFGRWLVDTGHEVTILCDTVIDPQLFPEFRFIVRRPFKWGESSRLTPLRRWAEHTILTLDHDLSISFHPAFPAPVLVPLFGWQKIQAQQVGLSWKERLHPRSFDRLLVERKAMRDPRVGAYIALSNEMAVMLREVMPARAEQVICIPGASPVEPPDGEVQRMNLRRESRAILRLEENDVAFLWAGKRPALHGRRMALEAFAELKRQGDTQARLVIASGEVWHPHDHAVSRRYDDDIRVLGRTQDMEMLLAACDVGLMPARYSTLGRFIWECLAFGKPVIATSRAASASRLRAPDERVAGRIIPSNDVLALAKAMGEMTEDPVRAAASTIAFTIAPEMDFSTFSEHLLSEATSFMPQAYC